MITRVSHFRKSCQMMMHIWELLRMPFKGLVQNLTFFARRREFHIVDEVAVQNLTFHEGISAPRMFYQVLHQGAPTGCKRQNDQVD